jgi:hypothetical protein
MPLKYDLLDLLAVHDSTGSGTGARLENEVLY